MRTLLYRLPVLIACGISAVWGVAIIALLLDVLWERFGAGNPYYGEALSIAPNMPVLAAEFLLYFAAVPVPSILLVLAYRKFVLRRFGQDQRIFPRPPSRRALGRVGWGAAFLYFAFLTYLNWNVWRTEIPDREFGWWASLRPLLISDLVYGGGGAVVCTVMRWWWRTAIQAVEAE